MLANSPGFSKMYHTREEYFERARRFVVAMQYTCIELSFGNLLYLLVCPNIQSLIVSSLIYFGHLTKGLDKK